MNITRWASYLILNVFVSASVAVAVLMYWDKYQRPYANIGTNLLETANVDYQATHLIFPLTHILLPSVTVTDVPLAVLKLSQKRLLSP